MHLFAKLKKILRSYQVLFTDSFVSTCFLTKSRNRFIIQSDTAFLHHIDSTKYHLIFYKVAKISSDNCKRFLPHELKAYSQDSLQYEMK